MRMKPMFSYYGSKYLLAPSYPGPRYNTIIEPFAGSACYSLLHGCNLLFKKTVILNDLNPIICMIWDYLINVKRNEFLKLPLLKAGEKIPNDLPKEAQYLIGFWVNKASTIPKKTMPKIDNDYGFWSSKIKYRIANQLQYIRHWEIHNKHYVDLDNYIATWFIDPPYKSGGKYYKFNNINYKNLANWAKNRDGEIIVCENGEANWLDFKPLKLGRSFSGNNNELIYLLNNGSDKIT